MGDKLFYTIRETAKTGVLSEYALRILVKQNKIPYIKCGVKVLINYPLLLERLNEQSRKSIIEDNNEINVFLTKKERLTAHRQMSSSVLTL